MVDYLCREGVVVPARPLRPGRGKPRQYSFGEILALSAFEKLLAKGVSVRLIKKAVETRNGLFREATQEKCSPLLFVTDGQKLYVKGPEDTLYDLTQNGQMAFSFMLNLQQIHAEVVERLAA